MKKKLLKLYKEDFQKFIKLISLLYGVDEDGLEKVLIDKYNSGDHYFIIDKTLTSVETVIENIVKIVSMYKTLEKFKVV